MGFQVPLFTLLFKIFVSLPSFLFHLLFKGTLSWLRQFLAAGSPLKMMKNAFHFTSKALFALKTLKFLSGLFGQAAKRLDKKDQVNLKFHDVKTWLTIICNNTNIA